MEFIKLNIQLFAITAKKENKTLTSKSGPNKGRVYAEFTEADVTADDIANNQTRITAYGEYSQGGSYAQYNTPKLVLTWYDNNENKKGKVLGTKNVTALSTNEKVKIEPTEFTVKHLEDGTLKGYLVADWIWTGSGFCCNSGSATTANTTLYSIPRAKTIGAISSDIGYDTTITLGQTSELFTTTIEYECGELKDVIADKTTLISIPWKIPTEFYSQLAPTDKEINVTLSATTFNGEEQVGSTQTTTFKAKVNESDNKPIAYLGAIDINDITVALTDDENKVVLNASNILTNFTGMAQNGATISSITVNGIPVGYSLQEIEGSDIPDTVTEIGAGTYTINKPTTNVFTLTVSDSRGFTNTITNENQKTLEKIDYIIPSISATFKRNTPVDGLVNVQYEGKFFNGLFKEGTSNTLQMAYQYRDKESDSEDYSDWIALTPQISETDNTYGGQLQLEELFNYEKQFDFRLSVKDLVNDYGVVFTTGSIAKGKPSHWYDDENFYVEGGYYQRNKETGKWFKPIGNLTDLETDDKGSVVKAINSVNERTTTNIMTIGLTANKSLPISTAWSYLQLLCDSVKTTIGDKLTFENNAIKIGAGVKYVRVSANAMLNGVTGDKVIMITKNSTIISQGYSRLATANHYGVISLTSIIIPVTEGDLIMLKYGSSVTGTLVIAGGVYTYLTVEAIA